jgi:hypothetical protein
MKIEEIFLDRNGSHYYPYGFLLVPTCLIISFFLLISNSRYYRNIGIVLLSFCGTLGFVLIYWAWYLGKD